MGLPRAQLRIKCIGCDVEEVIVVFPTLKERKGGYNVVVGKCERCGTVITWQSKREYPTEYKEEVMAKDTKKNTPVVEKKKTKRVKGSDTETKVKVSGSAKVTKTLTYNGTVLGFRSGASLLIAQELLAKGKISLDRMMEIGKTKYTISGIKGWLDNRGLAGQYTVEGNVFSLVTPKTKKKK